ncbi:MAG: SIR2 family protein [candidate division Zixibacteria bacterium]|nr:SIR2 family protein [candidate division Zixibacteria bacterium]
MPNTLRDKDWTLLLGRIRDGECTPFLGAGACYGTLPLGSDIARKWADKFHYPLQDSCDDLARVAQFMAVDFDSMFPKGEICRMFKDAASPDFNEPNEPHGILADLPLPIYITTNYDDFMVKALASRRRDPKQELCRWNKIVKNQPGILGLDSSYEPTPANPVVFHLHGHFGVKQSLVLTEDDYLDFLISISKDQNLLPPRIQGAFAGTSLLFLGYRLADWDFRVLFRSIYGYLERSIGISHVSVQLTPSEIGVSDEQREKVQEYLDSYFGKLEIKVYWGTCREFAAELKKRWEEFDHG